MSQLEDNREEQHRDRCREIEQPLTDDADEIERYGGHTRRVGSPGTELEFAL